MSVMLGIVCPAVAGRKGRARPPAMSDHDAFVRLCAKLREMGALEVAAGDLRASFAPAALSSAAAAPVAPRGWRGLPPEDLAMLGVDAPEAS